MISPTCYVNKKGREDKRRLVAGKYTLIDSQGNKISFRLKPKRYFHHIHLNFEIISKDSNINDASLKKLKDILELSNKTKYKVISNNGSTNIDLLETSRFSSTETITSSYMIESVSVNDFDKEFFDIITNINISTLSKDVSCKDLYNFIRHFYRNLFAANKIWRKMFKLRNQNGGNLI